MTSNKNLHKAKSAKNDEFYTQLVDVEKELQHYIEHFKNKSVLCNCNDSENSAFYQYFFAHFDELELKKLVCTSYNKEAFGYKLEYMGEGNFTKTPLMENGDFRSQECIELLKEADIIVTNPPFSLFREFTDVLIKYGKKFLVMGNITAICNKDFFSLIQHGKVWLGITGRSGDKKFVVPNTYPLNASTCGINTMGQHWIKVKGVRWFTNLEHHYIPKKINLVDVYDPLKHPTFDNYNAINVNFTKNIPKDFDNIIGVPITFLDRYNPEQFEIIGLSSKIHSAKVLRLHDNAYYNGYTRGKVKTRVDSNMPLLKTSIFGGIKASRTGSPDLYQLYYRLFIRRKDTSNIEKTKT